MEDGSGHTDTSTRERGGGYLEEEAQLQVHSDEAEPLRGEAEAEQMCTTRRRQGSPNSPRRDASS